MKIFNTLTKRKKNLYLKEGGGQKFYACGPTVYNLFSYRECASVRSIRIRLRYFEYRGYKVTFVQNFTDIDDKMIKAAAEQGTTVKKLGDRFIEEYYKKDAQGLERTAGDSTSAGRQAHCDIVGLISKPIETEHAYVAKKRRCLLQCGKLSVLRKAVGSGFEDLSWERPTESVIWTT